ncbi:TetR/AcrR family transcriptional regulator [Mucilaginibacter terrae]|uniref:TetR/AcrR family transcriptional regulator n=1 Tax=Mucilaginibacter terrae TaxID=1955052 RepID=UPI00366D9B42
MTNFLKDKEQTKRRLINAVGEILKTEGPEKLGYRNVARKAGVDKQLIYQYFKTLDSLIETYIIENDYWMNVSEHIGTFLENDESDLKKLIIELLQNQFKYFVSREEIQRLIAWEISTKSPLMRSIHNVRESTGQKFFELIDDSVNPNKVNFRAIAALLVGGIYYADIPVIMETCYVTLM